MKYTIVQTFLISNRAEEGSGSKEDTLEIDGSDYILRTDSNPSESTMDTMSVASELEVHLYEHGIHFLARR